MSNFADRFKQARINAGVSISSIAKEMGISAKSARSPRPGWGGEEWRLIGCLILNVFFKNFQGSSAY